MSILRKTRFKSLLEGDMKKHGFFMIAEMLLIMIGITGALQIDNWNENVNNKRSEIELLQQLEIEFEGVSNIINSNLENTLLKDSLLFKLYKSCGTDQQNYSHDEVLDWVARGITTNDFDIYQGVLEDAISTGRLALVTDEELRIALYAWKNRYLTVLKYAETDNDDISVFLRKIYHSVSFRNYDDKYYPEVKLGRSQFEYNPNDLFNDMYFENITGVLYYRNKQLQVKINEGLITPLNEIRGLIDSELSKAEI